MHGIPCHSPHRHRRMPCTLAVGRWPHGHASFERPKVRRSTRRLRSWRGAPRWQRMTTGGTRSSCENCHSSLISVCCTYQTAIDKRPCRWYISASASRINCTPLLPSQTPFARRRCKTMCKCLLTLLPLLASLDYIHARPATASDSPASAPQTPSSLPWVSLQIQDTALSGSGQPIQELDNRELTTDPTIFSLSSTFEITDIPVRPQLCLSRRADVPVANARVYLDDRVSGAILGGRRKAAD